MGGEIETHDAVIGFSRKLQVRTNQPGALSITVKCAKDKNPATIAGLLSLLKTKN
jgi:hypothetical protein